MKLGFKYKYKFKDINKIKVKIKLTNTKIIEKQYIIQNQLFKGRVLSKVQFSNNTKYNKNKTLQ